MGAEDLGREEQVRLGYASPTKASHLTRPALQCLAMPRFLQAAWQVNAVVSR